MKRIDMNGPKVDEVRECRHEISARYGHDWDKYFQHLLGYQERYRNQRLD